MKYSILSFDLKSEPQDIKNAGIISLSCAIALFLNWIWPLPQIFWAAIITFFLPYTKVGTTPFLRHASLLLIGLAATLCIAITTFLSPALHFILPWLFTITIILYILPRYIAGTQLASTFVLVFAVLAYNMPVLTWHDQYNRILAVLIGTGIVITVNFIFDHQKYPLAVLNPDRSLLVIQRAIRIALAVTFAIFICNALHIKNSAWVTISLIVVDQNSLGATIKKASKRLIGTIIGLALGTVLVHYIFHPYPLTQLATLGLAFIFFSLLRHHYAIAISIGTILLCDLFYILYSHQTTLFDFILNRIADTSLGVAIGIISCAVIFPQTLLHTFRSGITNFWQAISVFLKTADHSKNNLEIFVELNNLICSLNQDIKDFRYEPTSLIFRRYRLCIQLVKLMRRLLKALTYLPDIYQKLPTESFQLLLLQPLIEAIRLCSEISANPNCKNIEPLQKMKQQISSSLHELKGSLKAKRILMTIKLILEHYEKMTQTPRWRLEFS